MFLSEWFIKENGKRGHRSDESGVAPRRGADDRRGAGSFVSVRDVFAGRFTQYFVLSSWVFKRKCIEFVPSVCLFSQAGTNKHLRMKREIGNSVWVGGVITAYFGNKVAENQTEI
jgi:hypothetical protein